MDERGAVFEVPPLTTSSSEEEIGEDEPVVKRRRGSNRPLLITEHFDTEAEVKAVLHEEGVWAKQYSNESTAGCTSVYRCRRVPTKGPQCPAQLVVHKDAGTLKFEVRRSGSAHAHNVPGTGNGLSREDKELVKQLQADGVRTPMLMKAAFSGRGKDIDVSKLRNYLQYTKSTNGGTATVSVAEILEFVEGHSDVPQEENEAYVVNHEVMGDADEQTLRVFFSSKRLLRQAHQSKLVCADGTYKCTWHGFPVLLVGTVDCAKAFHPLGLAVTSGESNADYEFLFASLQKGVQTVTGKHYEPEYLMADAAPAITNGFKAVFKSLKRRLQCFFHVQKAVKPRIQALPAESRSVQADIDRLYISSSDAEFNAASDLFIQKWKTIEPEFLAYFTSEWLGERRFWYVGAGNRMPSTNNALESTNGRLKDRFTKRNRMPVGQFMRMVVEEVIPEWSRERDPTSLNSKEYALDPPLTTPVWRAGYNWAIGASTLLSTAPNPQSKIRTFYAQATGSHIPIATFKDNQKKKSWDTFDAWKAEAGAWWIVEMEGARWHEASCTCPSFSKHYVCKHNVGIAIRLKMVSCPPEARSIVLGRKPRRGRPSKAKKALIVQ